MSRPNSPSEDRDSSDDLSKEMLDEYPDDISYENRISVSPNNRSSDSRVSSDSGFPSNNVPRAYLHRLSVNTRLVSPIKESLDELVGDIDTMIESATSIIETANEIRTILQQSLSCIDVQSPSVSKLGLMETIRDLRRETVRAVVDGDRAHLRYGKVLTEFAQLQRCLRRLGVVPAHSSYGVHYSRGAGGNSSRSGSNSARGLNSSAGLSRDLDRPR